MPTADAASGPGKRVPQPAMWWTKRALALHVTVVVVVPAFLALFWWQVQRVRQGNTLSWAYVFEWPFFTGYAVYLWWKLVHDQPAAATTAGGTGLADAAISGTTTSGDAISGGAISGSAMADAATSGAGRAGPPAPEDEGAGGSEEDDELAAYNRYLAELNASGRRKSW